MAMYGTSQIQVQRSLCLSTAKRAQRSLQWSAVIVCVIFCLCYTEGLLLYAAFNNCDPLLSGTIAKHDQLVPYYIVSRLQSYPGLTGLCFAGIFSGSLSTISSALNSLATVTVVDFMHPILGDKLTPTREIYIAKFLCGLFGVICIGFTFTVSGVDSISQATTLFLNLIQGPVLAIFLIGVLTRKGTDKCAMSGFLLGVLLVSWIGFGTMFNGHVDPSLPLETSECPLSIYSSGILQNFTVCGGEVPNCEKKLTNSDTFILYRVSYMWVSTIGFVATFVSVLLLSFVAGGKDAIPSNSTCISPIARSWTNPISNRGLESLALDDQKNCTPLEIKFTNEYA